MKTNARDYLLDYANGKANWFRALILESINTSGNISDDYKKKIYSALINDNDIVPPEVVEVTLDHGQKLSFVKLKHKQGVNALASNQLIKFSNDITILYGLNGAGKSGYFRILNEIVGGQEKKEIKSNIYSEEYLEVEVDIEFAISNVKKPVYTWYGVERAIDILNQSRVFDSTYQTGLLSKRDVDSLILEPLNLNLFEYIVSILNEFRNRIDEDKKSKLVLQPQIDTKDFNEDLKQLFKNNTNNTKLRKKVESYYNFDSAKNDKLLEISNSIKELNQINIKDKITLHTNKKNSLTKLLNNIKNLDNNISKHITEYYLLIDEYIKKKGENEAALGNIKALNKLPGVTSNDWKSFIESGKKYTDNNNLEDSICPYCWQPIIGNESVSIIKAYTSYLSDTTEKDLEEVIKKISKFKSDLTSVNTLIEISEDIKEEMEESLCSEGNLKNTIELNSSTATTIKVNLLKFIEELKKIDSIEINKNDGLYYLIEELIEVNKKKIKEFDKSKTEKKEKLVELEKQQNLLIENKSINEQQENIKKWFELFDEINNLVSKISGLNSRGLTNVSKSAHEELLTESLKESFSEELRKIGFNNLDVNIKSSVSRGKSSTTLRLKDTDKVEIILSEGEQKGVALALFIAELKLQNNINPIILDDPVNSLDHRIAASFAKRLMELDNQIILFIHNKLFLDAFESTSENHVCKTVDSDCNKDKGKHIKIYEVERYSKNETGYLKNYKGKKLVDLLKQAEKELRKRPFNEHIYVAGMIRRAVEATIDEVVLNGITPTKYSNKNSRISWDDLRSIDVDKDKINLLQLIHSRASGSELHNGTECEENPIDVEEFNKIIMNLKQIAGVS